MWEENEQIDYNHSHDEAMSLSYRMYGQPGTAKHQNDGCADREGLWGWGMSKRNRRINWGLHNEKGD